MLFMPTSSLLLALQCTSVASPNVTRALQSLPPSVSQIQVGWLFPSRALWILGGHQYKELPCGLYVYLTFISWGMVRAPHAELTALWFSIWILGSGGETWHGPVPLPAFPLYLRLVLFYTRSSRLAWDNLDPCLPLHALYSLPGVQSLRGTQQLLHLRLLGPKRP